MTNEQWFSDDVPDIHRPWQAAADRYQRWPYRRVGASGLLLPPLSLGLWFNFGDNRAFDDQRAVLRHAFDVGINHFDLANNYGPPYGSAEENFGRMMRGDFRPYRDELVISTKAGWDMWPGPYGFLGSRKYLLASLDESLKRLSVDHVDIFYSHRSDADTPVAETIGALDTAVRSGKALWVGISSYSPERTREAVAVAAELGTPLVIHQPAYSLLNRWVEDELLDTLRDAQMGSIAFTALAQGLLTDLYLADDAVERATERGTVSAELIERVRPTLLALSEVARDRGQSLAQLALSWVLRPGGATSVVIGASSPAQIDENVQAVERTDFTDEELSRIDAIVGTASDPQIDLWAGSAGID